MNERLENKNSRIDVVLNNYGMTEGIGSFHNHDRYLVHIDSIEIETKEGERIVIPMTSIRFYKIKQDED